MAVRTNHNLGCDDGVAAFTHLVGDRIVGDLPRLCEPILLGGVRHDLKKG